MNNSIATGATFGLSGALVFMLFILLSSRALAFQFDGLVYEVLPDNKVDVTRCVDRPCSVTDIEIPNTVENNNVSYDVTRIAKKAFDDNGLITVTIGESVESILDKAFRDNNLISVVIGSGVERIGIKSFLGNSLTTVTIPDSVTTMGMEAFRDNSLESVNLSFGITSIEDGTFQNNNLTSVIIPDSVKTIGDGAFNGNALTSLTIPDNVTTIGLEAFKDNSLESVTLSGGITSIEDGTFQNNKLTSVIIPGSVESIGFDAFRDNLLKTVDIPSSIASIGDGAFENNELTSVTIPVNVEIIGGSAFSNNGLQKLTIPDNVTHIDESAFYDNQLNQLNIGNSVTNIGNNAFSGGNSLTSMVIPSSVTLIAFAAFQGNSLTRVNFQGDYYGNFFSSTMFLANDQLDTITYCEGASNWDGVFFNIASAEDATEVAVTPVDCSLPSTPTIDSVIPGDRQVDIAFTPTAGAQVTDYQYRLDNGSFISAGILSPFTITQLINGKDYSIVIRAVNVEDASVPSDTQTFTPDVLPGAPTIDTATPGDDQVEVAFSPGSGERISDYQYRLNDGPFVSAGISSPFTIISLTNGTDYAIAMRAVNTAGSSAESNTLVFTPKASTRPGAPIILSVESGDGELRVRFSAPNDGGTSIKSYTVTCGSASASGTASPITVSSLSNGVRYTCSVVATNAIGDSPASAVSEAVPDETSQTGLPMWLLIEALKVRDK